MCVLWRGGGVGRGVGPGMVAGRDGEVTQGLRFPNNPVRLQKMSDPQPSPVHRRDAPCVRPVGGAGWGRGGGVGPGRVWLVWWRAGVWPGVWRRELGR